MKTYTLKKITGAPDWNAIEVMPIDTLLWCPEVPITASAQLCYDENAIYVRLSAQEPHIRAEERGPLGVPCEDSCLEFFFSPHSDDTYFNFEANPNGSLYVGYGLPVLSTNVYTMAKIIRENDFGEVAEENAEDYAAAIQRMLGDREKLGEYRRAMRKNMEEKHLWVHRVDKIVADMTGAEPKC